MTELLLATVALRPYVFAFVALFVLAGTRDLGLQRTVTFAACVWPLAWLAEFSSTRIGVPFGLYHYTGVTRGAEIYLADVPLMDSMSFTFLAYASYCVARAALAARWRASRAAVAATAGFVMMLLDVVIDPIAVHGDRWFLGQLYYYPHGGAYFGVPLSNFTGWVVVGAVGVAIFLSGERSDAAHGAGPAAGVALYYAVLMFSLGVTVWIGDWRLLGADVAFHTALAVALWGASLRRVCSHCLYQQHARVHAATEDIDLVALVRKGHGLRRDYLEVVVHAAPVAVGEEGERLLRRLHGTPLLLGLLREDAQSSQVLLDLLERGERGLTVAGDGRIVGGQRGVGRGAATPGVEDRLRD